MYIVTYLFKVKPGKTEHFIDTWEKLTELIFKYNGSLGSRLHQKSKNQFIAYAQWPSQMQFENGINKLPKLAQTLRQEMRCCCKSISVLNKMKVVSDLLK